MRTIRSFCATAALLSTAFLSTPPAAAGQSPTTGANEVLDFCDALIASGAFPDLNLGECVAFNITPGPGFKALFCDFLRETGQLEDAGLTYAQCIRLD
jgi:hypothetical protein